MTLAAPVRYTPAVEAVAPDEADTIASLIASFDVIADRTMEDYGHAVRPVHAKAHGLIRTTLTIDAGLPPELAQGLFAAPGEHPAVMRFSTNPGDVIDDAVALSRGLAVKVLDVDGERLPGAAGRTQDFLFVNGKTFTTATPKGFSRNLKLLAATTDRGERAKIALSAMMRPVAAALKKVGIESKTLATLGSAPQSHPLGETYFSATPFRHGEHIAKFSLAPVGDAARFADRAIDLAGRRDGIRETIRADMASAAPAWEFRVQLCRDLERMPIEDAAEEWPEDLSPFQRVGMIRAAPQDSWSDDRVSEIDEGMRFSVWTGLAAHRPLGGVNRARRETYDRAAEKRATRNGCPLHEPAAT